MLKREPCRKGHFISLLSWQRGSKLSENPSVDYEMKILAWIVSLPAGE